VVSSSVTPNSTIETDLWQWREWQGLPYLTCSLLENWQHGFFTQQFWSRTPEDLVEVLDAEASVYRVKQVHGNTVLTPSEIKATTGASFPDADGAITEQPQQAVWAASADCNPVLIGDIVTGQVAAIHAGWRGTAQKILPCAIARFQEFGSDLKNLRIAMGAAISGEVYQVSEQVAVEVGRTISQNAETATLEEILAPLEAMSNPPILDDPHPHRRRLDVRRVNQIQLEQLGIATEQIAIAPYCTYQQPDLFFSYRRTKEKKVQWSGIISKQ